MQTVLITGASSGLGQKLAEVYSYPGVNLCLIGRDKNRLDTTAKICEGLGAQVTIHSIDIKNRAEMQKAIEDFDDKNPIDLVIANAGIGSNYDYEEIIETNIVGIHHTLEPLIPRMKHRRSGQIGLMSSLAAFQGFQKHYIYGGTKAYIKVYGQGLRMDLSDHGVKVSVITPGYVETPMTDKYDGSKPLLVPCDKACKIIKKGLEKNKCLIAFPRTFYLVLWLFNVFPPFLTDFIVKRIK